MTRAQTREASPVPPAVSLPGSPCVAMPRRRAFPRPCRPLPVHRGRFLAAIRRTALREAPRRPAFRTHGRVPPASFLPCGRKPWARRAWAYGPAARRCLRGVPLPKRFGPPQLPAPRWRRVLVPERMERARRSATARLHRNVCRLHPLRPPRCRRAEPREGEAAATAARTARATASRSSAGGCRCAGRESWPSSGTIRVARRPEYKPDDRRMAAYSTHGYRVAWDTRGCCLRRDPRWFLHS
jgi:hypothetical protein